MTKCARGSTCGPRVIDRRREIPRWARRIAFGIEHTDAGSHAFELAGGADASGSVMGFHCNARDWVLDLRDA